MLSRLIRPAQSDHIKWLHIMIHTIKDAWYLNESI